MTAVPIPLETGKIGWVHAGPTRELPEGYGLVRCAKEIRGYRDRIAYDVGTSDYEPFSKEILTRALPNILRDIEDGKPLYIGCMGGVGRTGTLLSILVAQHPAFTGETAIEYIRGVYRSGAVETVAQKQQVNEFAHAARIAALAAKMGAQDFAEERQLVVNASSRSPWWQQVLTLFRRG